MARECANSRVYSGNLNAFKAATNKLYQLDFCVLSTDWYDPTTMNFVTQIRVEDRNGDVYGDEVLFEKDPDVLINNVTAWLNNLYETLSTWSKPE